MADAKSDKPKPKRRIKNPETFRERAIKAAEDGDKPQNAKRPSRQRPLRVKPPKPVAKPLGLVGKVLFPVYLRNSWQELKLVTWPSKKESRQLTFAVMVFAVVFGAAIALVDYGLDKIFKGILLK